MPILRYLLAMVVLLFVAATIQGLVAGDGSAALGEAAFALVWVGWITIIALLPPFLVFLWLLPRSRRRLPDVPILPLAVGLGFVTWVIAATIVIVLLAAAGTLPVGQSGVSAWWLLVAGAQGAYLGLIEGIARARRTA
jgi:hypothetical protein